MRDCLSGESHEDGFRKEVEDLKIAMETAQQVQQTLQATTTIATSPMATPTTSNADVSFMMHTTKRLMEFLENGGAGVGLPDHVVECMASVNQSILAIEPVRAAKLGEAIGSTDPDAEFLPDEDYAMEAEACVQATAVAIMEQIQGAQAGDALETVRQHLRTRMKGTGTGNMRYTPGCVTR